MTVSIYARQIAKAQKQIKRKGQLVTWRKQVRTPNAQQPWKATQVPQDFPAYILPLRKGSNAGNYLVHLKKGTDVPEGAPSAIMGAQAFTPDITDKVIRGAITYTITAIDCLNLDGNPILWYIWFE